jgi:hypothetical protein
MKPRPYEREEKRPNNRKRSKHERYTAEIGRTKEKMALIALSEGPLPAWIKSYRRAGHPEDVEGKDLVILTDVGPVFIQIKSSVNACREYLKKERKFPVGVVLIKSTDPLTSVRSNLIAVADRLRRQLIQK